MSIENRWEFCVNSAVYEKPKKIHYNEDVTCDVDQEPVIGVINFLTEKLNIIASEGWKNITIDICGGYDEGPKIEIDASRMETPEDIKKRRDDNQEAFRKDREKRREVYLKLKEEFEP